MESNVDNDIYRKQLTWTNKYPSLTKQHSTYFNQGSPRVEPGTFTLPPSNDAKNNVFANQNQTLDAVILNFQYSTSFDDIDTTYGFFFNYHLQIHLQLASIENKIIQTEKLGIKNKTHTWDNEFILNVAVQRQMLLKRRTCPGPIAIKY